MGVNVVRCTTVRGLLVGFAVATLLAAAPAAAQQHLEVGFGEVDITPQIAPDDPVWLAGYTPGRRAIGVHDPLFARCIVLGHADQKIALASVDLVGLQYPVVKRIREELKEFQHVTVSSTHNHEGPDVIGIWGRSFFQRGVDDGYLDQVVERIVAMVRQASEQMRHMTAVFGSAEDESLLHDGRLPIVKDGILRALRFTDAETGKTSGLVVQWNCHPEALGSRNRLITADFPASTVAALKERHQCPVVYFSGAVGGLMAPPREGVRDENDQTLSEGDFRYAEVYGKSVADLTDRALNDAQPTRLTPFHFSVAPVSVPVKNPWYRAARLSRVVRRQGHIWTGDYRKIGPKMNLMKAGEPSAVVTEVGYLRFGELGVVCVPGEIYPELVYGKIPDPAEEGVDYPDAEREASVAEILPDQKWMLLGLANDEIGYIIPRRQWDHQPPYAYGRRKPQYGEINSCGPDVGPIIMKALADRVAQGPAAAK